MHNFRHIPYFRHSGWETPGQTVCEHAQVQGTAQVCPAIFPAGTGRLSIKYFTTDLSSSILKCTASKYMPKGRRCVPVLRFRDVYPGSGFFNSAGSVTLDWQIILVQGGQMKSGQILSCNNSKTVLNIVFKFYTLVTEYISCLQRPVTAQWLQVLDLWQRLRGQRLKEGAP